MSHGGDLEWALHGGVRQKIYSIPQTTHAEASSNIHTCAMGYVHNQAPGRCSACEPAPKPFAHIMLPGWARG